MPAEESLPNNLPQIPEEESDLPEIITAKSLQYDFGKIKAATNGFSDGNKLGQGGFGVVYLGNLNGKQIAVKRLSMDSRQRDAEFKNEVVLVAGLQHRNLVKLLGFSMQGKEKLLIYEFVENSSLDRFIFDPIKRSNLNWMSRHYIIMGIAKGLLYLHEGSRLSIIHRDMKSSNILLDGEMNPKIADFGMARLFTRNETHCMTARIVGTLGYMAPEYITYGHFSVKSDVFGFGVLMLEIISGQRNNTVRNGVNINLLRSAWTCWHRRTISEIVDPVLNAGLGIPSDILRCVHIGLLCVQDNATARPTMRSTVLMLSSPNTSLPEPLEPSFIGSSGYGSVQSTTHSSKNDSSFGDLYRR